MQSGVSGHPSQPSYKLSTACAGGFMSRLPIDVPLSVPYMKRNKCFAERWYVRNPLPSGNPFPFYCRPNIHE